MEKTSALLITVIGIIFLNNRLTSSSSLLGMVISISIITFINCIITFSAWLCQYSLGLLSTWPWKGWAEAQKKGQINTNAGEIMPHLEPPCPDDHQVNGRTLVSRGDVEVVMEKLGISYDHDDPSCNGMWEKQGSDDIADLLDEKEVGLEEAKGAFDVFDDNSDGFIDGNELEKVLCKLGFKGSSCSGKECERMIRAFDENRDGVIDFPEFVKLLEKSFW